MSTDVRFPRKTRASSSTPQLVGAILSMWGGFNLLVAALNYGSIGSGFYHVEWRAFVGCVSLVGGLLLLSRHRMGPPVGLVAVTAVIVGNSYLILSGGVVGASLAYILLAAVGGSVLISDWLS